MDTIYNKDRPAPLNPANFATAEAWARRAEALRIQARIALGLWPMPARPAVSGVVGRAIVRNGYAIASFRLDGSPGIDVTGSLYMPTKVEGKAPLILHAHGHAPEGRLQEGSIEGARQAIANSSELYESAARYPLQAACATLARMGCVVAIYDMLGYAERRAYKHRVDFADARSVETLVTEAGLQSWGSLRLLDWLIELPQVDRTRVGVIGQSGGASQAMLLGVLDDRPTWFFLAGMIGTAMQGGCVCENAPLLRLGTNNVELAGTIAPRHVTYATANDWTKDFATSGWPELRTIYDHFGASERVEHLHFEYGHNFNAHTRAFLYESAAKRFGLPVLDESTFEPIAPSELRGPAGASDPSADAITERWLAAATPSEADAMAALKRIVARDGVAPLTDEPVQTFLYWCYSHAPDAKTVRERLASGESIDWDRVWLPGQAKYGEVWRRLPQRSC
ncbi:MAG: hypothetical protein QM770_18410 [Tepidisphaeraceae bacterium]